MCSLIPPTDGAEAADFRRGYFIAGVILAAMLALEVMASVWLW